MQESLRKEAEESVHDANAHAIASAQESDEPIAKPISGIDPDMGFFKRNIALASHGIHNMRLAVTTATPKLIVNNSITLVAAFHIVSELLMLKSGGLKFMKNNRGGEKPNIFIDPANNLMRGLRGIDAAERGIAKQNVWGLRSTAMGFSGWLIGIVTPNPKDNSEKLMEDARLYEDSKLGYFGRRVLQGFALFNPDHKRQTIGMGVTVAGIFSALAGFTNIGGDGKYYTNKSRAIGGLITATAGASLWFSLADRDAWSRFGAALWMRLPFIAVSVKKMHNKAVEYRGRPEHAETLKEAELAWKYYAGGAAGFQGAAITSFLIGGAEKAESGEVIDQKAIRDNIKKEAREEHKNRIGQTETTVKSQIPTHTIMALGQVEKALPHHDKERALLTN